MSHGKRQRKRESQRQERAAGRKKARAGGASKIEAAKASGVQRKKDLATRNIETPKDRGTKRVVDEKGQVPGESFTVPKTAPASRTFRIQPIEEEKNELQKLVGKIKTTIGVATGKIDIQDPKFQEILAGAKGNWELAASLLPLGILGKVGKGLKAGRLAVNSKTNKIITQAASKLVLSKTWKTIGATTLGLIIGKEILALTYGGKNFGQFIGMEEASQTVSIAGRDALLADDLEGYEKAAEARNEVLIESPGFWKSLQEWLPFRNVEKELEDYRKAAITAGEIYDKLAADRRIELEEEKITGDKFERGRREQERINKEKAEMDIETIDHFNEQRKIAFDAQQEALVNARRVKLADEKKAYQEEAAFWAKNARESRKLEAQERINTIKFWLEYQKLKREIENSSRRSNLSFRFL